ncbi:MAG: ATP-binding protein [Thermodesulfovibrionales bacterium]|nr:ATP-binding protein [Thermodesulfovibrionales bacterium]
MPENLNRVKKRLLFSYIIILLLVQFGLPLFYLFFSLNISDEQTAGTINYFLAAIPVIGGIFSIYIPIKLFKPDTSYPVKVVISNAAGTCLIYMPAMLLLWYAYDYSLIEIAKIPFLALSIGLLQCLTAYLFTLENLYPHLQESSGKKSSLYYKNLFFIASLLLIGTIIVGSVAFNAVEQSHLSARASEGAAHLNGVYGYSGWLARDPWNIDRDSAMFDIFLAFLLSITIGVVLSSKFTALMNLPLKELMQSARDVSEGRITKARAVTGDEIETLTKTFNQMAESVREREEELILRGQHLALLYSFAEAMNQNKTTEELFDLTMDWLDTTFSLEVGALRLLTGEFLKLEASKGIEQDMVEKIEMVRVGESIAGLAALRNDTIIIEDIPTFSGPYAATAKELGLECLISVPLRSSDRLTGTLSVGSRSKRDARFFNDIHMLNSISNLLGIAIERSCEFDRIEEENFQWETAINSIKDIVSIHDTDLRIKKVNPAFLEHFGCKEEDVLGKHCFELFHGAMMPPHECPHTESMLTRGKAASTFEVKDGKMFSIAIHPLFRNHSAVYGCIHIARDVTETIRLREQLHQADKLGALGRLASGIAHNVNNPLTYSLNYLFILRETASDEKARELIKKAEQGIEKSKIVLEGLLDFSTPAEGNIELIDVAETVKGTVTFLSGAVNEKNIRIHTELPEGLTVWASQKAIEEVLINLITNSIDAGANEMTIEGYGDDPKDATITLADNGSGILKEHIPRLFEPYFTTKPKGKGTGLGLYVSYNIIKSFDGNIWCESKTGAGTKFFITLPRA